MELEGAMDWEGRVINCSMGVGSVLSLAHERGRNNKDSHGSE